MSPSTDRATTQIVFLLPEHPPSPSLTAAYTSRLQECGAQCGSQPENRITKAILHRHNCSFQSFTMRRRHCPTSCSGTHGGVKKSRNQFPLHNMFRKKSFEPSCPKHRKHISNRGRRKSVLDTGIFTRKHLLNKTESRGHPSQHSTQQRDLPERPGHSHCHCQSSANVR